MKKSKNPKTWSEFIEKDNRAITYNLEATYNECQPHSTSYTPIEKSALALLKIHQLIEVGYGGNVTRSDYIDIHKKAWGIDYDFLRNNFYPSTICYSLVAFHTEEQAKEFLSYPENIELLKAYYMICSTQQEENLTSTISEVDYEQLKQECWEGWVAKHGIKNAIPEDMLTYIFNYALTVPTSLDK